MSEAFATLALEALASAVIAIDLEGRVAVWNAGAEDLFGWSSADVFGKPLPILRGHANWTRDEWLERVNGMTHMDLTTQHLHRDGRILDVHVRMRAVTGPSGERVGSVVTCADVSTELSTATKLHQSETELWLVRRLANLAQRILSNLDLTTVLQSIVQVGCDLLDTESGVLSLEGNPGEFSRVANVNIPDDLANFRIAPGEGLHGSVLASGLPIVVDDYDTWMLGVGAFKARGFHASMAAPISRDGRVIGGISIHSLSPQRRFEPEEVEVLVLLAEYAAVAITNASAYRQVSAERERFLALVEAMPDGLAVVEGGVVTAWNARAAELTGHSPATVIGKPPPVDLAAASEGVEVPVLGDRARWIETVGSDLPDGDGHVYLLRDMTDQRDLERAKDLFFAATSHELKTPLTVVKGLASTLHRHWDRMSESDRVESLETIERRAESLARLIDRILVGSRVQAGAFSVSATPVDLRPVVADVVRGFGAAAGATHVVRAALPENVPLVAGDRQALDTILGHLIENAIKYSPDGGEVVVSASLVDGPAGANTTMLQLTVADEGIGIEGDVEPLLSAFVQGDGRTTRRFAGVGLGLYIVRELVEAQGGELTAEPGAEKGSRFSFTLPLAG